jgi:hypothetical protein
MDISTALAVRSITWTGAEQRLREQEQGRLRRLMGDEAFDAAYRSGAGLSRSQAVELALGRAAPRQAVPTSETAADHPG